MYSRAAVAASAIQVCSYKNGHFIDIFESLRILLADHVGFNCFEQEKY